MGKVLAFIITGISTYGGISNLFDIFKHGGPSDLLSFYYTVWFVFATLFGIITNHVAKTKGYENGFFWGYWLGIVGLLVVGLRGDKKSEQRQPAKETVASSSTYDPYVHLERLSKLHSQGALTDEEFQKQKALILSRM